MELLSPYIRRARSGLADIFKDLMVDVVVEGGQTMNPSVDAILTAINNAQAKNVYVLPNNSNIILAANQAKARPPTCRGRR